MKAVLVVLATVLISACATPGEKHVTAPVIPFDEGPRDALGDWNSREPLERLLLPTQSDLA